MDVAGVLALEMVETIGPLMVSSWLAYSASPLPLAFATSADTPSRRWGVDLRLIE